MIGSEVDPKSPTPGEESLDKRADDQTLPFYPVLAAVFPILATYSANLSLVPVQHLARPLFAAITTAVILQTGASILLKDKQRGAAAAAALLAWLWSFSWLAPKFENLIYGAAMPGYIIGGLVIAGLAARWRPKAHPLNLVGLCITVISVANILWLFFGSLPAKQVSASTAITQALPPGPRPDIFHIVLDGFGRADVLKERMDLDLSGFIQDLENRGFQVVDQARTSYVQTELSVSSTLNMELLQKLLPESAKDMTNRQVLKPFIQEPAVAQKLMASGYRYVAVGTGFDGLWLGRYQLPDRAEGSFTLFEGTLLSRTPWRLAGAVASSQYDLHRSQIKGAFAQLEELAAPTSKPRFVVAHILAPHPPFVFDKDGGPVRPKGPFGYWDGSDFMTFSGTPEEYREGYRAKAGYITKRLISLIDKLQSSGRRPIIILQGDHGSKVGLDQNSLARTDLREAFCNLYAVSVPSDVPLQVPELDTSVNTYRRLFTAMGAEGLTPYPPQSWYSTAPKPFVFTEVSARLDADR